ncbi:exonuclease domain-containing protein [uncultured Gemmiger sp.]|uniref:exonuclease domain-containing protein n=1 Tax=uncultured Gemmiger sp. TaxID=1623490 RepID=UPI0025F5DAB5|nr:exonuclease domain-containing protein [uncultured Gemmiger sp.]
MNNKVVRTGTQIISAAIAGLLTSYGIISWVQSHTSTGLIIVCSLFSFFIAYIFILAFFQTVLSMLQSALTKNNLPAILVPHPDSLQDLENLTDYIVLDTETTGLSPKKDQLIEIGILTIKDGKIVEEYTTLIQPTIPVPKSSTNVNGITQAALLKAPPLEDVVPEIAARIKGQVIVGHNVRFDLAFVSRALVTHPEISTLPYIDTLNIARRCISYKSYSLQNLSMRLCLDSGNKHRALDDAKTTYQLLQYCIKKLSTDNVEFRRQERERRKAQKQELADTFSWSPLFDINFAFTGDFVQDREYLEGLLADVGANLRERVNTKTVYLVVGDISHLPEWAVARKNGTADNLIAGGQNIIKISETEYLDLIKRTKSLKHQK